jgi:acyl dehydratase
LEIDLLRLVHGEHEMGFLRPLRDGDVLAVSGRLSSVSEKPSGNVFEFELFGHVDGTLALHGRTAYFIRAPKRPEKGASKTRKPRPQVELPEPVQVITQRVTADQADRYAEASGDRNPIHLDDATAKRAGLPGVILHGLCTMAFAGRDLVNSQCGADPTRLARLGVRFARPVFPGETLTLKVFSEEDGVSFQTENAQGKPVLTQGRAVLR